MGIKHTAGPWERITFSNHEIQTDFAMVKIGGRVHMVGYSQEDCANALIIAAAPELLEAMEELLAATQHLEPCPATADKARAAIAKAKGEER